MFCCCVESRCWVYPGAVLSEVHLLADRCCWFIIYVPCLVEYIRCCTVRHYRNKYYKLLVGAGVLLVHCMCEYVENKLCWNQHWLRQFGLKQWTRRLWGQGSFHAPPPPTFPHKGVVADGFLAWLFPRMLFSCMWDACIVLIQSLNLSLGRGYDT